MFERLGAWTYRARLRVLSFSVLAVVIAAAVGIGVFPRLASEGFNDPSSDSEQVATLLTQDFGSPEADLVIAITFEEPADASGPASIGGALAGEIRSVPGVLRVTAPWPNSVRALLSADGTGALILVTYDPASSLSGGAITDSIDELVQGSDLGAASVYIGGGQAISKAINSQIAKDLARAETIAIPLTFILLLLVFGSLIAAGMPLLIGVGSIVGSFLFLFIITFLTDVSVFSINVVTGLGLGLGIDYALLMVSRFREELATGTSVGDAVARTVSSAGRTVVFSGITVALTLAGMLFFPQYFLRSFAYAGMSVVLFAVIGALITLPAALGLLGHRVNALRIRKNVGRSHEGTRWANLATAIMRNPWPVAIGSIAVLLALAWPALNVQFGQIDERALPGSDPSVIATGVITSNFPDASGIPIDIIVPGPVDSAALASYAGDISLVPGVTGASSSVGVFVAGARVADPAPGQVTSAGEIERIIATSSERPRSPEGEVVIADIRAVPAPVDGVLVGGIAAEYTDSQQGIARMLPWALGWVLITVLILLFMFTGSILLPIKAVLLNILSLSAAMGVLVWVFQEGHLTWLVGDFTNTGTLDTSTVIVTAIVAFGLSMDYEVFLLSRIKEEYDRTGDNTASVAFGLQRSAGIITAAALLLAVVFASFLTCTVTNIKILGLGVTVAILLDATIVRVLLVPAFMRIAGRANWWAPPPLRRFHARFGLTEHESAS